VLFSKKLGESLFVLFFWFFVLFFGTGVFKTYPQPFAGVILETGSHFLHRPAWTTILLFYVFHQSGDNRCAPPHPAFSIVIGSHKVFCPGCPGTIMLPISASCITQDGRHILPHPAIGWDRVSQNFSLGICDHLISASQVPRNTGMSHWHPACFQNF
jgi:hypothetical protein